MSVRDASMNEIAVELGGWFKSILRLCDAAIFSITESEDHREATILHVLTRNARTLINTPLDRGGALYSPLCFMLAAASRKLRLEPTPQNWKAAIQNVMNVGLPSSDREAGELGLSIGTRASIFKSLMDEALIHAGVTDRATILDEQNRRTALGLAINWGMRFLLTYALEARPRPTGRRAESHDLAWVRGLVEPLTSAA